MTLVNFGAVVGGERMTVLMTELPLGVRLLNFAVSAAGDDETVAGAITRPKIFAGPAALAVSANAANADSIKKPSVFRMLFIDHSSFDMSGVRKIRGPARHDLDARRSAQILRRQASPRPALGHLRNCLSIGIFA
ncbi:MAG TPA: hypothetical protein PLW68_07595 [Casimicrobiaceae bacterium]|nr:hypothetical protein [Casimicrobiaceae bacterium]